MHLHRMFRVALAVTALSVLAPVAAWARGESLHFDRKTGQIDGYKPIRKGKRLLYPVVSADRRHVIKWGSKRESHRSFGWKRR